LPDGADAYPAYGIVRVVVKGIAVFCRPDKAQPPSGKKEAPNPHPGSIRVKKKLPCGSFLYAGDSYSLIFAYALVRIR
jgi:hypothetical protein